MQLRHLASAIALTLALSSPALAAEKSSGFKCWTNKDGVRECGNVIPPEYAQGRTETVNKRGMTTQVEERAKTAAELAAEQRQQEGSTANNAANSADTARKQAEEQRKLQEQANYDRMINASFLKEADIEAARKRKLSSIDASIDVTRATIGKLEVKLQKEEQKAAAQKKPAAAAGSEPQKGEAASSEPPKAEPQKMAAKGAAKQPIDDVESLKKQIADKQAYIANREQERAAVNAEYDGYLNRFRELKGITAP